MIGVKAFSVLHIVFAYGGFPTQVEWAHALPLLTHDAWSEVSRLAAS